MAETIGSSASGHPNLNLNAEEQRAYGQLLKEADPDGFGAVSGDVAVRFFERTKLPPDVLGQIWQIADTENRGFLTPAGFGVALRLIGHAQAAAPLPRFDNAAQAEQPHPVPQLSTGAIPQQSTGNISQQPTGAPASPTAIAPPPIRVPALTPDKVAEYSGLFEKSGAENGYLPGLIAKQIFERARLPNEVLGRIWALSDTQGRGSLNVTEFVIAMHLLASYKSGQMRGVPNTLPPGLHDAASRRPPVRMGSNSRPGSSARSAVPPQLTGFNARPQSPITRQQVSTPLSAQSTGDGWVIAPADKARFDSIFATVDRQGLGFITGEQAVEFFGNARLPEEVLAQIWDLADINSEGKLNKDEFAVAMYLVRQQRGTKDGRGNLPSSLPPALIPPSMRRQQAPPSQPTAPSFENAPVTKPRSAADDLFGLDAFGPTPSAPAPAPAQAPQSTGGTDAGPFANPPGSFPSALSPQTTSTTFKPFIPSSSFGQSIIPQSTGSPAPQARSLPAPNDDLLGDADPEVSAKLTNETSELGNLSNQVSTLSNQTTDLQGTRKQTEQELSNVTAQKRAFEGRLAQLRSLYEKEVQEVKALQEQLATSKNETKRLQQDIAMIDGSHQDLSTQHQQLRAQLENDQRENAALKERIRQTNQETEQLKPQLEKLRSDARQQKGLVAINKKQLATNEAERDRLKAEIAAAQKLVEDAQREAEESARELEASKKELEEARSIPVPSVPVPAVRSPPTVASPTPSTSSNPFFRRTTETTTSPPVSREETKDNHSAFDNIFGPSFGAAAAPAPSVSFSSQPSEPSSSQNASLEESPAASSTLRDTAEPPAPPQSRQLTSAALPFRRPLGREDSISSSVQVAPPASRLSPSDTPRALTPATSTSSPSGQRALHDDPFTAAPPDEEQESVRRTLPKPTSFNDSAEDAFGTSTPDQTDIPGAFPSTSGAQTPAQGLNPAAANEGRGGFNPHGPSHEGSSANTEQNFDEYFGGPSHQRTASQKAADFDSAFVGMGQTTAVNGEQNKPRQEFPDIQEFAEDDSSDYSESTPMKFEDDFSTRSPPHSTAPDATTRAGKQPEVIEPHDDFATTRPPLGAMSSTATSLPGVEQQKSPPSYGEVVPEDNPSHFPPEFKGLLPEREDPTSPTPTAGGSTHPASPPTGNPPAYGPEAHARSASDAETATAPPPTKAAPFDFDSAFSGMGSAPVEDDNDDEEETEVFTPAKHAADFDPTFDSPPQTKYSTAPTNSSTAPQDSIYASVTNGTPGPVSETFFGSNGTVPTSSNAGPASPVPAVSHDWDSLFAPLNTSTDSPSVQSSTQQPVQDTLGIHAPTTPAAHQPAVTSTSPPPATQSATIQGSKSQRPELGRALSMGTEHDDPILKRLTAMGWSREESLDALEKFDYNIDKAADYLTFRS
ncbi:hypothetical protein LTS07_001146 [Exophiala sideris]|uniref:Actin cytoskeleton-regulatory complex protein END3 n=1 Tax=Exophiala sideris TaxID=1016849 RepID=A0ABR0JME8_9EURO|nr:hypothetical protein LTS07_001146 [Exophiala sideris]KAK5043661.1 hypothetical protein LTR13_000015 [Exophiala sideris]KAK5067160.1 hypothetical protein LTR69_001147 [Exophiala sideris]KAK5182493.1 hypothetical protein LTR44_004884 [Eurotiomycetes sp. CCFEE 6388]